MNNKVKVVISNDMVVDFDLPKLRLFWLKYQQR